MKLRKPGPRLMLVSGIAVLGCLAWYCRTKGGDWLGCSRWESSTTRSYRYALGWFCS